MQVYRSLLHWHAKRIRNQGNLRQSACRCDIPDAFLISIEEIYFRLKACVIRCNYFRKHGQYYRQKHLYSRLNLAKEKEEEETACQILAIIQQEKDKQFWWRMAYAMGRQRGGSCFRVQVTQEGETTEEFKGQAKLQRAIWDNIHQKRFHLAESAPICQRALRRTFGYNAI